MSTYIVALKTSAWTYIEVEADDEAGAIDEAADAETPGLCAQCSGWGQDTNLELSDGWEVDSAELKES